MLEDRIASLEVYAGAFFGGYPVIHVNDRLAAPEVAHILADSGTRALFHTDGRSEVVAAADARTAVELLVTIGADRAPGASGFEELVSQGRSDKEITPRADGDLAIVGYTSGTTLLPKGAMISQRALCDWTGDLGRLDEAGYVYVTGRAKELIISGGMNVYPAEVEAALASLPGVAECAVLGLPDERWGEAVTAVIVPAADAALTPQSVIAHVRTQIASYKRPQRVVFAQALPRNASLKVRKDVLRAELAGLRLDGTTLDGTTLDGTTP
jgi:acyl-CoA synthetase (AMP-forming)/AMP-acid ligase II